MASTIYIVDLGVKDVLNGWLGISTSLLSAGVLHLYSNNYSPSDSTVIGDLTEATFPGYAGNALTGASWNAVTVTSHIASTQLTAASTFRRGTGGSPQTIYGAYITDSTNTYLLAAWEFASGPYTLTNPGDAISTTPQLTSQSLN